LGELAGRAELPKPLVNVLLEAVYDAMMHFDTEAKEWV
jgi:hypothetical protein